MFYVLDENHNLIEAYDKEGVLAVLSQAIADGSLSGISADAGFVSKLKCCVGGVTHQVAFVSQAKYNELKTAGSLAEDCMYFITDDTREEDLDKLLATLTEQVNDILTKPRLLQHVIHVSFNHFNTANDGGTHAVISIINNDTTEFTKSSLYEYLKKYGFKGYPVQGFTHSVGDTTAIKSFPLLKVFATPTTNWGYEGELYFMYADCETSVQSGDDSIIRGITKTIRNTREAYSVSVVDTVTRLL